MPPKSSKKMTKAEKDKQKQEEEESKLREEEEQRQKKEQEEAERAEKEKLEAEQRKKLEVEEAKRRKVQLEELNDIIYNMQNIVKNQDDARRRDAKWERYMRCDGSADPSIAREINTYINLQKEDNTHSHIEAVLPTIQHIRELIEELEFIMEDTPDGEISPQELERYSQTTVELEDLINEKLDMASHDITLRATQLMNQETLNLESTNQSKDVRLYIWGNLCKNPRIKQFEFADGALAFNVPKLLTLSDCAYRCLITRFDHYSHRSKSFHPRKKIPAPVESAPEPAEPEQNEEVKPENEEGEGEAEVDRENTEEKESQLSNELMAMLDNPPTAEDIEEGEKEDEGAKEEEEVIDDDLIKSPAMEAGPGILSEPDDYEDFDGDEDMVDLRAYRPLSGVMKLNLLHLPPQPKLVKTWTITQNAEPPHINEYDYIADDVNPQAQQQKVQSDDDPATKREERPPIVVQLKLQDEYFFFEDPLLARWDEEQKVWKQDGFQDTSFVEESRRLSFKTCYFGTFALMQDVHINMPFQSWEIRPKGLNHCLFTLIAAIVELEIEIKDDKCCLRGPADRVEVAHLRGKWFSLFQFTKALKETGINIFPNEDSHKYVTTQDKNVIAETRFYEQVGLTASGMAYSWSKWNVEKESEKIIVQAAPRTIDEPLTEDEWSLLMITRKRCMKLKMSEFDEEFSEDYAEGTEFHADTYHMALQLSSEEGQKRIMDSSNQFVHTVSELVKSTRLLIYA